MSASASEALFARLAARLLAVAHARAVERRLARRGDPRRWRSAALLWPGFGKD